MADMARVEQVFDRITAENLSMGDWANAKEDPTTNVSCGTTMCFAGHAAVAAGKTLKWEPKTDYTYDAATGRYTEEKIIGYTASRTTDGEDIEDFARNWLDLNYDEADRIFYATGLGNRVDDLRDHVTYVVNDDYSPWDEVSCDCEDCA